MAVVDGVLQPVAMRRQMPEGEVKITLKNSQGVAKRTTVDDGENRVRLGQAEKKRQATEDKMLGDVREVAKAAPIELPAGRRPLAATLDAALENFDSDPSGSGADSDDDEPFHDSDVDIASIASIGAKQSNKSLTPRKATSTSAPMVKMAGRTWSVGSLRGRKPTANSGTGDTTVVTTGIDGIGNSKQVKAAPEISLSELKDRLGFNELYSKIEEYVKALHIAPFTTSQLNYDADFKETLDKARKDVAQLQKEVVSLHIKSKKRTTLPKEWFVDVGEQLRGNSARLVFIVKNCADSIVGKPCDTSQTQ